VFDDGTRAAAGQVRDQEQRMFEPRDGPARRALLVALASIGAMSAVAPLAAATAARPRTADAAAKPSAARVVRRLRFDRRLAVVVAEGDFESRAIGSYSVRVYRVDTATRPDDETSFFAFGTVRPRDGSVDRIWRADALRLGDAPALVVSMRAAGSGRVVSADAFELGAREIRLRASVSGLRAGADPVAALARRLKPAGP
jgi:hypothetical protein